MDFWTIFFLSWLMCSTIVAFLVICKNPAMVGALSMTFNTYGDLLYASLIIALGPSILIGLAIATAFKLMDKPLPWKKIEKCSK